EIISIFEKSNKEFSLAQLKVVGFCYYTLGNFEKAIQVYEQILKSNPEDSDSIYNLMILSSETGDFKQSEKMAKRLLKLEPRNSSAYRILATAQAKEGNLNISYLLLQKAHNLSGSDSEKSLIEATLAELSKLIKAVKKTIEFKLMNKKLYVHVAIDSPYTQEFIDKIIPNFREDDLHLFLITDKKMFVSSNQILNNVIVEYFESSKIDQILLWLTNAYKIIIHGNFNLDIFQLVTSLKFTHKTSWVIWGGDIYNYYLKEKHTLNENLFELLKIEHTKELQSIGTYSPVDYDFAKKVYGNLPHRVGVFYPVLDEFDDEIANTCLDKKTNQKELIILLGNSATQTMSHLEILQFLSTTKDVSISFKIICPLSYGDMNYAAKVEEYGKKLLGNNFVPIRHFMNKYEYSKLLASVDIGIFNSARQQAMGNILKLLRYGKTVYVKQNSQTAKLLNTYGFYYKTIEELFSNPNTIFALIPDSHRKSNIDTVISNFSKEKCIQLWKSLLE
ncbi:MAG TPA: TDP-N-acetylfucosamine:lipid II N-acetylfucosaminyltransferase, partial [Pseudothermotoga sp.]